MKNFTVIILCYGPPNVKIKQLLITVADYFFLNWPSLNFDHISRFKVIRNLFRRNRYFHGRLTFQSEKELKVEAEYFWSI
jgi:hypothetical protein